MMERVTTLTSYNSVLTNLMNGEVRQSQEEQQVSSGKIANDLAGFGSNAEALVASQSLKSRVDNYVQTATALTSQLDSQNLGLTQVSDAGQSARQAVAQAVASGSADGLMNSLQSYFSQAVGGLNTQYNGAYLFAGGKVDTPPVAAKTLADLTSPPAGGVFQNDQLAASSRLDESTTLQTGVLASNVGSNLFNAFQQIEAYDQGPNGPLTGQLTTTQSAFLTNMMQTFDTVNKGLTNTVAANGLMQNRVTTAQTTQQQRQTSLQTALGGITDVDMAQAISQLNQTRTSLQASAKIFSTLQSSSLLGFLTAGVTG